MGTTIQARDIPRGIFIVLRSKIHIIIAIANVNVNCHCRSPFKKFSFIISQSARKVNTLCKNIFVRRLLYRKEAGNPASVFSYCMYFRYQPQPRLRCPWTRRPLSSRRGGHRIPFHQTEARQPLFSRRKGALRSRW